MRHKKALYQMLAMGLVLATMLAPTSSSAHPAADRVMYLDGTSNISGYCQYEWKKVGNNPVRDELGIPQPAFLPSDTQPSMCRDGNPNVAGIQIVPCKLQRNLGTYPPYWRGADVTQAEVGLNPPCAGQISANTDLLGGCLDATTGDTTCRINAPTWFYGYCGQTYGGATGGTLRFQGEDWTIDRMGFPRGRGAWEFSGKISRAGHAPSKIRFYFAAAPSKPEEAAACDIGGNLSQITFNGIAIVSTNLPARVVRTRPGWHFCADDPIVGAGGTEGC